MQVRAAGISGQGPVQDLSLFPVELFPFFLMDHQLYFADVRAFPTVEARSAETSVRLRITTRRSIACSASAAGTTRTQRDPYFQLFGVTSRHTAAGAGIRRANVYVPFGQTFDQTSLGAMGELGPIRRQQRRLQQAAGLYLSHDGISI